MGLVTGGVAALTATRGGREAAAIPPPVAALTRDQVVAFAGAEPERCVFAKPGRELCTWSLPGRVFRPDEDPVDSDGVKLVCELPSAATSAGAGSGSCRVHPLSARAPAAALPPVGAGPAGAGRDAPSNLASARDVTAISHLVGDAPQRCRTRRDDQLCEWELQRSNPAHVPLVALARADGPLRLRCRLPLDGRARPSDSCAVGSIE
jgi:hypothetical protein